MPASGPSPGSYSPQLSSAGGFSQIPPISSL
jgi:hypothetical protein